MSDPTNLTELVRFMRANGILHFEGDLSAGYGEPANRVKVSLHPEAVKLYDDETPATPDKQPEDAPRDADGLTADEQELLYGGRRFIKG